MGFRPNIVIRVAERAGYRCEVCKKDVSKVAPGQRSAPFEAHSATGFHFTRIGKDDCFVATSVPEDYHLKKSIFSFHAFVVLQIGRDDDGFCICLICHDEIHRKALRETKKRFPNHKGNTSAPAILEEITLGLVYPEMF